MTYLWLDQYSWNWTVITELNDVVKNVHFNIDSHYPELHWLASGSVGSSSEFSGSVAAASVESESVESVSVESVSVAFGFAASLSQVTPSPTNPKNRLRLFSSQYNRLLAWSFCSGLEISYLHYICKWMMILCLSMLLLHYNHDFCQCTHLHLRKN